MYLIFLAFEVVLKFVLELALAVVAELVFES